MKIIVTGSAGFIGYNLCKQLCKFKNFKVLGIDSLNNYYNVQIKIDRNSLLLKNKNFSFVQHDLSKNVNNLSRILHAFEPEVIVHLAAQPGVRKSIENPKAYLKNNIIGTFNILDNFKDLNSLKLFLHASTSSIYSQNDCQLWSENLDTNNPKHFYAASKKSTEVMLSTFAELHNIRSRVIRFFTVYGPYGRPDMALYSFAKNIMNDQPIDVFNFGNHKRDFTYIDDAVDGVIKIISSDTKDVPKNKKVFDVINIGRGKQEKLSEFINLLEKNLKKRAKINYLPFQQGDALDTFANISKAKKIYGFNPKTNINEGIKKFVSWFSSYHKLP